MSRRDYQPGERVPGTIYQVVRVLGAGGMGTVYEVEDTSIGKRYVLKTLHPELGQRQDLARRMQNEARALARLQHPNIVEVFTAGVTTDDMRLPFYVMERLSGQSLRYVLQKRGAMDLAHSVHIAIDLLDALDEAHGKGIVHRDVKPDNIFLHRTGAGVTVTKLLDFGIMSVLDGARGETGGRFLGTLRYASPEQLKGEKPSPRMDIYAAGLVLFEMLTGRGPFDDEEDPAKIAAAHIHREAPLVSRYAHDALPDALVSLVRASLLKDPARRPQDAFAFASQLRALKKAFGAKPGDVSTEHRATAPAVLSAADAPPSTPPMVNVQPGVPASVLSPLAMSQALGPAGAPGGLKTTVRGMTPPTVAGGTLENAPMTGAPMTLGPTLASAGAPIDRNAPTHSLAMEAPRMPMNGTDPLGATMPINALSAQQAEAIAAPPLATARVVPSQPPPAGVVQPPGVPSQPPAMAHPHARAMPSQPPPSPIQWPTERPEVRSESGQARTLSGGPTTSRPTGLIAVLAVLVVVAVIVSALAIRRVVGERSAATAAPSASTITAPSEPASSEPASAPSATPAPSATAALSAPSAAAMASASVQPTPSAAPKTIAPAMPPKIATPAQPAQPPATPAPPKPADRPGPGF
jgi:serine/threonine-protein kinase